MRKNKISASWVSPKSVKSKEPRILGVYDEYSRDYGWSRLLRLNTGRKKEKKHQKISFFEEEKIN